MGYVCVDTQTLIWGVRQRATAGQEEMIQRAGIFVQECQDVGDTILVPAVVLGELLAGIPPEEHDDFFQTIHKRFVVAPFDGPAALVYGQLWYEHRGTVIPEVREADPDVTRSVVKADHMIAATAVATRSDVLVTDDKPLARFSEGRIAVRAIRDVAIPAKQTDLFTQ